MTCVACNSLGSDRHHIKSRGAGGSNDGFNLVILCRKCHTTIHVLGPYRMSKKYPLLEKHLQDSGWEFIYQFGVMKLRRKNE